MAGAIYIRHNFSIPDNPGTLQKMWDDRVVALHYEDLHSTDPDKYQDKGKKALRRLHDYCQVGDFGWCRL